MWVYNRWVNFTNSYAVETTLRQHFDRESSGSQFALTLTALLRSDRDRLEFFDGDRIVVHEEAERRWAHEEHERVCVEIASADPILTACLGFSVEEGCRPQEDAWLIDADNHVIDVARERRLAVGFLGVRLRAGEVASWSPHQHHAVASGNVTRLKVA